MSDSNNWHYTERLTNEDFILLLPYLSLENQYLTQVKRSKWKRLIDANFQTFVFMCGACNKPIKFEFVNQHFKSKQHLRNLRSNVGQLYHPFYTYGKGDSALSQGEKTSKEHKEAALKEVNTQIKSFAREAANAKHFVEVVNRREKKCIEEFLTNLSLETKAEKPEQMFVSVCIPFYDLPELMFCGKDEVGWKQAVSWKDFNKKSTFTCNICTVKCSGIDSLNSHLKGFSHKCEQLEIKALLYEKSSKVTKYCTIFIGAELMISVHENAKSYYKDELQAWQNRNNDDGESTGESVYTVPDLPSHVSTKAHALEELTQKFIKQIEIENRVVEPLTYWGHVGVEYVLRVNKHPLDEQPTYECGLCEIIGNDERMQRHLLCFEHMKKYLVLHYMDTMRKYENAIGHMRYADYRAVMGEIVTRVAVEIEKHHGRSLPYTVSLIDYRSRRSDLISEVYNLLHASQVHGPSFLNVVPTHEIEKLKSNCHEIKRKMWDLTQGIIFTTTPTDKVYLHRISHDPNVRLKEYYAKQGKKQGKSRSLISEARRGRSSSNNREKNIVKSRSRSPRRCTNDKGKQNIWDVYRRELAIAATQIEHTYDGYRVNPESHPLYEQEWNDFWQNRKMELEREGLNHRTYNFQPEWVHFFKQRIELLFGDALQKAKIAVRCKLNIPLDAEEDESSSRHEREKDISRHSTLSASNRSMEDFPRNRDNCNKRRSHDDYDTPTKRHYDEHVSNYSENRFNDSRSVERNLQGWTQATTSPTLVEAIPKIADNHSNIVHVLRLMTALEDHLGSLGPKVMDMLANALQLEKTFHGDVVEFESRILTCANCNILETAMEKLKGILFAGLLDDKKLLAFNRVIQFTTELLKYAEKMGWRQNDYILDEQPSQMSHSRRHPMGSSRETDSLMDMMSDQSNDRTDGTAVCPPPPVIRSTRRSDILTSGSSLVNFNTQLVSRPLSSQTSQKQQQQQQQQQQQNYRESSSIMSRVRLTGMSSTGGSLNNNNFNNGNNSGGRYNNMDLLSNLSHSSGNSGGASRNHSYNNPPIGNQSDGSTLSINNKNMRSMAMGQSGESSISYRSQNVPRSTQNNNWSTWNKT